MANTRIAENMKTYRLQEANITIPENWRDQTINAFVLPANEAMGEVSFVVTRDNQTRVDTVAQFARVQIAKVSKQLTGFRLVRQEERAIGGLPGTVVDYSWSVSAYVTVCQRQGYVKYGDHFLILTLTTKKEHFEGYKHLWGDIVQSIRFHKDEH